MGSMLRIPLKPREIDGIVKITFKITFIYLLECVYVCT